MTLDTLAPGQQAVVKSLTCTGLERRRLMDLGILPGTIIEAELRSPLGDPTAYLVRGALVALRRNQARQIEIAVPSTQRDAQ
ncbi:MAG: ferrous iron transport protein A [Anaerolineae bacterium]|nr:ferrous iron transport protein A [Anaerolineae bacterium]